MTGYNYSLWTYKRCVNRVELYNNDCVNNVRTVTRTKTKTYYMEPNPRYKTGKHNKYGSSEIAVRLTHDDSRRPTVGLKFKRVYCARQLFLAFTSFICFDTREYSFGFICRANNSTAGYILSSYVFSVKHRRYRNRRKRDTSEKQKQTDTVACPQVFARARTETSESLFVGFQNSGYQKNPPYLCRCLVNANRGHGTITWTRHKRLTPRFPSTA